MAGCVAVLDIGKTNIKVLAFDRAGKRRRASEPRQRGAAGELGLPLSASRRRGRVDVSSRGPERNRRGRPDRRRLDHDARRSRRPRRRQGAVLPPMDYEWDGCDVDDDAYAAVRPPFDETFSPNLARGLNLGRQLFHLLRHRPADFARARAFLTYPQYWAWRLSGVMASEATSLGCHSDLWRPREADFSTLVDRLGWRGLLPALAQGLGEARPCQGGSCGGDRTRPHVQTLCGAHDSNAALAPYLAGRSDPFTVLSTGTWVIIMAVGGTGKLDPAADMLANVDVRGEPVPTARFMGGREFSILAGAEPAPVGEADVAAIVARGTSSRCHRFPIRAGRSPAAWAGSRDRSRRRRRAARRWRRSTPR